MSKLSPFHVNRVPDFSDCSLVVHFLGHAEVNSQKCSQRQHRLVIMIWVFFNRAQNIFRANAQFFVHGLHRAHLAITDHISQRHDHGMSLIAFILHDLLVLLNAVDFYVRSSG